MKKFSLYIPVIIILFSLNYTFAQYLPQRLKPTESLNLTHTNFANTLTDTVKSIKKPSNITHSGIFLSVGGGLSVPLRDFSNNSKPAFGILGRLEFGSTAIFPFVPGVEINYFSYKGTDNFITPLFLNSLKTKILSYGVSLEYTLSRLLNSSYTIPFLAIDVKSNKITRVVDPSTVQIGYPGNDSRVSVGMGFGFTLFIFDFYVKYNYMKELSNLGFYTKVKFPVIQF